MKIDFENPKTTTVRKWFNGELETGEKFTIDAEWTDWDGWEVIEIMWDDKGEIILNTSQIGKIQVYIEREQNNDKSYRNTQHSRQNTEGTPYPVRTSRTVFRQD